MKTCGMCKIEKSKSEFTIKNREKGTLQSHCKPCKKAYNVTNYSENKVKRISQKDAKRIEYRIEFYEYLKTLSCIDCGNDDFRVLEFDHLSDKSYTIANRVGAAPLSTLMKEIDKCEPVCANCHKIRTAERGDFYKYLRD